MSKSFGALVVAVVVGLVAQPVFAGGLIGPVKAWPKPDGFKGACPKELKFYGSIKLSGQPGTLNYHWERNDGAKGPEVVVEVKKGQQFVSAQDGWTVTGSGKYQQILVVNSGNQHVRQGTHPVSVTCK